MPELMETMYANRSKFKKQMLKVQQEYEHDKSKKHLLKEISRLNNLQMAMKIALNSAYGAMGNQYFRYFDIRMAEGITTSGQLSIRWMANKLNAMLNKTLKTEGKDFVVAIDTDSIYLKLEDLVEKLAADKDTNGKIKYMDRVCEEVIQPFIDTGYQELAEYMNAYSQKMFMKRETIADKGIWKAKKMYILNAWNVEGVQYDKPKLKMQGIEAVRSSTPHACRVKIKEALGIIMNGTNAELKEFVNKFYDEFQNLPFEDVAFPRGVKNLKKYRTFVDEEDMSDDDLIKSYLELNKYHPVTFGEGSAANPEELKVKAMEDFVSYIKGMAGILNKRAFIKNDISNNFIPMEPVIGFSDDDIRNVEVMSKHFKNKPDNIVKTYSTAGGIKKEVK